MPNEIQLGEYSMSGGMEDVSYNSDGNPNLLGANRDNDGHWLNANWDRPDNRWDRENGFAFAVAQLSSFLSCFRGRVLFGELPLPSTEHLADLVYLLGQQCILFRVERFGFPKYHEEYFERIYFAYGKTYIGHFLILYQKTSDGDVFN